MYITYSIHSFFFLFLFFLGMGGVRGWWAWGDVWICFFCLFLVKFSLKPNPNGLHPSVHSFPPSLPKDRGEEKCAKVPRSHWKGKIKNVLLIFLHNFLRQTLYVHGGNVLLYLSHRRCFFTPQLFGCFPPLSPPAFSPPRRTRTPSRRSSSFLACFD